MTSSSAVSSPYRYSLGPSTIEIATSFVQPALVSSSTADRTRRSSSTNRALVAKTISFAPTACAAISAPSSTAYGLARRIARSLNVPGSPSAALTTTVVASTEEP